MFYKTNNKGNWVKHGFDFIANLICRKKWSVSEFKIFRMTETFKFKFKRCWKFSFTLSDHPGFYASWRNVDRYGLFFWFKIAKSKRKRCQFFNDVNQKGDEQFKKMGVDRNKMCGELAELLRPLRFCSFFAEFFKTI